MLRDEVGAQWQDGYVSEINLNVSPWMHACYDALDQGGLLIVDYGYPRREYYVPERESGTLRCYFQHRAHDNPLLFPGAQDVTSHVDFTSVVEAGSAAGFSIEGFIPQRQFLINCGLGDLVAPLLDAAETAERVLLSQQIQKLTMPSEMGDAFNVMGFSKHLPAPMTGFAAGDKTHRL
ncbi:MAG: SAM-dependent methyltransferase [Pseudomonadota bacterium]